MRIDDPSGGIAIHGIGGAWGTIAVGFLARPVLVETIIIQFAGLLAAGALAAGVTAAVFAAVRMVFSLRADEAGEFDGLDLAEHDINAYPDFQQTMIKSYHLREA